MTGAVAVPAARTGGRPRDPRLDEAIAQATIDLLASCGYDALSMEAVATGAGTTKTAIYRRWPSKAALVADVFDTRAKTKVAIPDTGNLRDDLLTYLRSVITALTSEPVGPAVLNMVAAARTHPDLAELLQRGWVRHRRQVVTAILRAAIARHEVRDDVDAETTSDLLLGPIYYRLLVSADPVRHALAAKLVDAILPGLPLTK
jgi:AcrR family transcriptional regulator